MLNAIVCDALGCAVTGGGRWVWAARRPWRRGRVVGARSGAGRDRSASQACRGSALVCGWRWDPALVFLVARPCSRCLCGPRMAPAALSRGPRRACLPAPPRRCRPRQIRLPIQVCHPEARHPGDHALERGGPDRDRTPPPAAARGERAGAIGSPAPRLRGWGSRGRPDVAPPTPSPPLPQGSPHRGGRPRAHAAHARSGPPPPAGRPAGPSGTLPQLEAGRRGPR